MQDARSAVHAVLERLGDGHFDNFIRIFLDLLASRGVTHHPLGALAAIDLADAGQGDSTAAGYFARDNADNGLERSARGLLPVKWASQ